jgi:D-alanyl-D-alanine carboxypeptidase (penicillin-binding protein 5/6)
MHSVNIKKILFLFLFIFIIAFISFNINRRSDNTSKADIGTIIPEKENKFNQNTSSKIMPQFDIILESNIVLIGNLKTGHILFQKNSDLKTNAASITKLLSSTVVLENTDLNKVININDDIYSHLPSKTDLMANENIKTVDLLKMALIMSSNDAINALSNYLGYYDFLAKMNAKANDIGMYNSHFDNPIGFDSEGNYSTALDLFQLAKYIYNNFPVIGEITRSNAITIKSESNIKHLIVPTNLIVDKLENYWGGKTGTTPKAKEALLAIFELQEDNKTYPYVAIVVQSDNRFSDIEKVSE